MFHEGQQIGPYTLIRQLGKGGFGEVWLAERRGKFATTKVAVKLPLDDQVDHAAIEQEAQLWEQASEHPNVLTIIEADEYDGQIVIVSEYAPDGSLEQLLKTKSKLEIKQAIEMTLGILNGLEFLHKKRIIHRDIKPANILLQNDIPLLADFGISRAMQTTGISSKIIGTDAYMSPESFRGLRTVETDIWSVGVVLYQLLNGRLPFPKENPSERMYSILQDEFASLSKDIPSDLRRIIEKALAKLPENRYRSANEMREDLKKVLVNVSFPYFVPIEILPKVSLLESTHAPLTIENETVINKAKILEKLVEKQSQREEVVRKHQADLGQKQSEAEIKQQDELERQRWQVAEAIRKEEIKRREAIRKEEKRHSNQEKFRWTKRQKAGFKLLDAALKEKESNVAKKITIGIGVSTIIILCGLIWIISSNLLLNGATNKMPNTPSTSLNNPKTFKNSIGMEFVKIPAGYFMMGSDKEADEKPIHKVTISNDFWMGKTEVTQALWKAVMGSNPSSSIRFMDCPQCPVESVSWDDTQSFIGKLNAQNDGNKYRLPTEAEWEYVARAGTTGDYAGNLDSMAWYNTNWYHNPRPVGTKQPNAWGLYDMYGNVCEWTADWYDSRYYVNSPTADPTGARSGSNRVIRGGGWNDDAVSLRSANRYSLPPSYRYDYLGFRVVRQ